MLASSFPNLSSSSTLRGLGLRFVGDGTWPPLSSSLLNQSENADLCAKSLSI